MSQNCRKRSVNIVTDNLHKICYKKIHKKKRLVKRFTRFELKETYIIWATGSNHIWVGEPAPKVTFPSQTVIEPVGGSCPPTRRTREIKLRTNSTWFVMAEIA